MSNDGSRFGHNYGIKKIYAQNIFSKLKGCFQIINGCSLVSKGLKWCSIYRVGEKLAISSHYAQNLSISVDRSVHSVDCTELAVTAQSNTSNDSFFEKLRHSVDHIDQIWQRRNFCQIRGLAGQNGLVSHSVSFDRLHLKKLPVQS